MNIKQLLENIDNETLSEDSKAEIQTVFESIVQEKVTASVDEKVTFALKEQDDSHAEQLNRLIESIDSDHSEKLTKLVQRLDEDHTAKLEQVVAHYEKTLSEDARNLSESLQANISSFLDMTLDELLPKNLLQEAVQNRKALEMVDQIKEVISFDPEFINDNIKSALIEGKDKIDSLRSDLNDVLKENVKLSTDRGRFEAEAVIGQCTASLPTEKKQFITESFKGKSAEYIKENYNYALKMFERREQVERSKEKNFIINEAVSRTVDTPKERSAVKTSGQDSVMNEYVSGLK